MTNKVIILNSEKTLPQASSLVDITDGKIISPLKKPYKFHRREFIPSDGKLLWQISIGIVRVCTYDEEGRVISFGLWGNGDIVGNFLPNIIPYQIECLTNVEAAAIDDSNLYIDSALISHVKRMGEFLQIIQQKDLKKRLICFLNWLFWRFGKDTPDGNQLNIHLTHDEIADIIGTTRVTVTRIMNQLQKEGFLRYSRQKQR